MSTADGTNNVGHGHVYKRPDGNKARCGAHMLCDDCRADLTRKNKLALEGPELTRLRAIEAAARALLVYLDNHDWGHIPEGETSEALRAALGK